eukprot:scpid14437/ scgid21373/ 
MDPGEYHQRRRTAALKGLSDECRLFLRLCLRLDYLDIEPVLQHVPHLKAQHEGRGVLDPADLLFYLRKTTTSKQSYVDELCRLLYVMDRHDLVAKFVAPFDGGTLSRPEACRMGRCFRKADDALLVRLADTIPRVFIKIITRSSGLTEQQQRDVLTQTATAAVRMLQQLRLHQPHFMNALWDWFVELDLAAPTRVMEEYEISLPTPTIRSHSMIADETGGGGTPLPKRVFRSEDYELHNSTAPPLSSLTAHGYDRPMSTEAYTVPVSAAAQRTRGLSSPGWPHAYALPSADVAMETSPTTGPQARNVYGQRSPFSSTPRESLVTGTKSVSTAQQLAVVGTHEAMLGAPTQPTAPPVAITSPVSSLHPIETHSHVSLESTSRGAPVTTAESEQVAVSPIGQHSAQRPAVNTSIPVNYEAPGSTSTPAAARNQQAPASPNQQVAVNPQSSPVQQSAATRILSALSKTRTPAQTAEGRMTETPSSSQKAPHDAQANPAVTTQSASVSTAPGSISSVVPPSPVVLSPTKEEEPSRSALSQPSRSAPSQPSSDASRGPAAQSELQIRQGFDRMSNGTVVPVLAPVSVAAATSQQAHGASHSPAVQQTAPSASSLTSASQRKTVPSAPLGHWTRSAGKRPPSVLVSRMKPPPKVTRLAVKPHSTQQNEKEPGSTDAAASESNASQPLTARSPQQNEEPLDSASRPSPTQSKSTNRESASATSGEEGDDDTDEEGLERPDLDEAVSSLATTGTSPTVQSLYPDLSSSIAAAAATPVMAGSRTSPAEQRRPNRTAANLPASKCTSDCSSSETDTSDEETYFTAAAASTGEETDTARKSSRLSQRGKWTNRAKAQRSSAR